MANNNNEGVDNNPDNSKDAGLDKSFVGKFVSGIFNSTPLSKWFGKDSTSKSTIRRREEDDDEFDTSCVFQPPTKRAKLPSNVEHNNYSAHIFESPVTVHNASNNINNVTSKVYGKFPEPAPGPSGIKSRKLFEKHSTASTNTVSTNSFENEVDVVNGDNDSDSEESTSGYSSAVKLVNKQKVTEVSKRKESREKNTPKSRSLFTTSNEPNSGRTLFTERSSQMNTSLSSRRPAFNASTFGSPNFVDRTLSTKRILSSPFYSGNTMYGGASAYARRLGKNSEDSNSGNRTSVQIKPVNEKPTTENATLSKTALRILSTLEQYSTPLSDAKKIPVTPRKPGLISTYVGATPYLIRDRKKPSNKELQVPSVPDLLQMKQKERLQNSTESVRQIATKSKSSLNKEEYKLRKEEDNKQKHSNKMKSSVASVRQKVQPIEPVSEVKLPKVSLPITTLPKFDFVMMPPSESSKSVDEASKGPVVTKSPVSTIIKSTVVVDKKETAKSTVENVKTSSYTFSEPLIISKDLKSVKAINCFKFSEPLCKKETTKGGMCPKSCESNVKTDGLKLKNNGENVDFSGTMKPPSQLLTGNVMDVLQKKSETSVQDDVKKTESTWECLTCLVKNDSGRSKCSACDEPKPATKLEKTESKGFGDQFKMSSDKWECSSCMVRNSNTDTNCVACSAAKPGDKPLVECGFGDKFKPPAATWECSSCLIRNKNEVSSCAACGTAKPGKEPTVVSSFGDKFKATGDTWECPTCMIRNKHELNKCAACETDKPGSKTQKAVTVDSKPMTFSSNDTLKTTCNTTFTFGIKPTQWECKTCLVRNNNDVKKCVACEMPKDSNNLEKEGFGDAFKMKNDEWECGSCLVKNKSPANVCVCCGVAKLGKSSEKLAEISKTEEKKPIIGFNFGITKSPSTQFKFGIPTTSSNKSEVKENVGAIPSIFGSGDAAKTNTTISNTFTFGITSQEKALPMTTVTSTSESATPSVASNPLLKPSEKLPEKAAPAPVGFKFGLDSSLNKTSGDAVAVSSSSKTETSTTSLASKPTPLFQFKPPAINGDINKPKDTVFTSEANKSSSSIFGSDTNKPKESIFRSDINKSQESPFVNLNKSGDSPFTKLSKQVDSPFTNPNKSTDSPFSNANKTVESPFGNASNKPPTQSPFGNANKRSSSPFANVPKSAESPFGKVPDNKKPKESLFGTATDATKSQGIVFGKASDTNKTQDTIFGGDATKPKDVIFGSKPAENVNLFPTPTSTPAFSFTPKPAESTTQGFNPVSSSQTPAPGIFKFGPDTSQSPAPVNRAFGESSDNVSNGFGSVPKMPAFGTSQGFGPTENKPFTFGSNEPASKSTGFSFGQAEKPSAATPVFGFGAPSGVASSAPNTSFSFPAPSGRFNFGSAAKVDSQPFNTPNNVFGSAGTGAKNGSFNFGPNANNNNQKAVFTFGANQTSQATQPSFPAQQNQPGFNFGTPTALNVPGAFNFAGAPPAFNFTDGSSGTAPPQRKIKKALRRTHR